MTAYFSQGQRIVLLEDSHLGMALPSAQGGDPSLRGREVRCAQRLLRSLHTDGGGERLPKWWVSHSQPQRDFDCLVRCRWYARGGSVVPGFKNEQTVDLSYENPRLSQVSQFVAVRYGDIWYDYSLETGVLLKFPRLGGLSAGGQ